jgi:hypothetical protein
MGIFYEKNKADRQHYDLTKAMIVAIDWLSVQAATAFITKPSGAADFCNYELSC